jgi:hypothetical protein
MSRAMRRHFKRGRLAWGILYSTVCRLKGRSSVTIIVLGAAQQAPQKRTIFGWRRACTFVFNLEACDATFQVKHIPLHHLTVSLLYYLETSNTFAVKSVRDDSPEKRRYLYVNEVLVYKGVTVGDLGSRTETVRISFRISALCPSVAPVSNHFFTAIGVPSHVPRYTTEKPPVPSWSRISTSSTEIASPSLQSVTKTADIFLLKNVKISRPRYLTPRKLTPPYPGDVHASLKPQENIEVVNK